MLTLALLLPTSGGSFRTTATTLRCSAFDDLQDGSLKGLVEYFKKTLGLWDLRMCTLESVDLSFPNDPAELIHQWSKRTAGSEEHSEMAAVLWATYNKHDQWDPDYTAYMDPVSTTPTDRHTIHGVFGLRTFT